MQSPLWFSWRDLSLAARFFVLVLASASVYLVFSCSVVLTRVHSRRNPREPQDTSAGQRSMQELQTRCLNMGQLIRTTFYLFGLVFFFMLPGATQTVQHSKIPVGTLILRNFANDFAYAADMFFVFLVLSLIQWFVSARVRASALRLSTVP